ncbi:MAG: SPASM domain-containing protein, partial [Proteobacteria bacterium]|nr:SPASM domain-containing protein [Pseudomonadota bacterium]
SSLQIETGFIVMKHNEHEIDKYKRYMSELGVDRASVIAPCVRTIDQGKELLPANREFWVYDEVAFLQGSLRPTVLPNNFCPWIYFSMAILVNGDIVPCCRDPHGKEIMGNIFDQSLDEIWNGKRYRNFRTRIHNNQKSVGICRLCSSYPPSAIH